MATRRQASARDAGTPLGAEAHGWARLSRRTSRRLLVVAAVAVVSGAIGAANAWLLSRLVPFDYDFAEFENGLRNGALIGASLIALELFYVQEPRGAWLRRASFAFGTLDRATLYAALIAVILSLNRVIFGLLWGFDRSNLDYFGLPLLRDVLFSFVVFLAISFVLQMRRVVGGRVLTNLLLGRYHSPVREERIFMLLDLKGSTALADRLGDERAHAFITSVFFDIDQPIQEYGGEVHRYVGDGLIATWPLAPRRADARCLRCWLAIGETLARRADDYVRAFGSAPSIRAALHAGPVVAGECGDAKLTIVYLGDTMNTAARIEQVAKDLDRDCLISGPLLQQVHMPPGLRVEPLGPMSLRGREQPVELYALRSGGSDDPQACEGGARRVQAAVSSEGPERGKRSGCAMNRIEESTPADGYSAASVCGAGPLSTGKPASTQFCLPS